MKLLNLFIIFLCFLFAANVAAQSNDSNPIEQKIFRIGYLRANSEGGHATSEMNRLRDYLQNQQQIQTEMQRQGFGSIGLYEADGPADLIPRLQAGEFDLVFCTSTIWHQVKSNYTIIVQKQQKNDILNPRTGLSMRRGVIFVSSRHEAFENDWTNDQWSEYLLSNQIAVVQSQSLSGYITPMLYLRDEIGVDEQSITPLWCRSGNEVAKSVVSGLVDVGACEERDLEAVFNTPALQGKESEIVKVIFRTTPVASSPVMISRNLSEESPAIVQSIQRALRSSSDEVFEGNYKFNFASSEDFEDVSRIIRRYETFESLNQN